MQFFTKKKYNDTYNSQNQSVNDKKNSDEKTSVINTAVPNPTLKIITLSGTEDVTKNMTVYECGDDIIIVDCGVGFPDSDMHGVDVVIPDMTYLFENRHRIRGLFITHGHEDHIGAVPYLLKEIPEIPIFANKLVQGFLLVKFRDKKYKGTFDGVKFNLLIPDMDEISVGCFRISAFRVNHSVPSSMGLAIRTPQGLILHMADYKVDWTPVLDKPIDIGKIAVLSQEGVLCLLSDCLGATHEGYSMSEQTLNETFFDLFEQAKGRQIFVTTISSNISRMYQIMKAAIAHGRKVVLAGRSIEQNVSVARGLGYLPFDDDAFVKKEEVAQYSQKDLVYIIAGCYGQQGSALDRLSRGEHSNFSLEQNTMVIFSGDPNPPGVAQDVERVMGNLTLGGAEVIYGKIQANLHVSGHGTKGDLTLIAAIAKAKYFIPIGGTVTNMRAYTNMISSLGFDKSHVFELLDGESLVFDKVSGEVQAKKGSRLELKQVFVDGNSVGDIGPMVIRDREHLSTDGIFVVVVPISKDSSSKSIVGKVDVVTRGFVYVKESKALIGRSKDVINKVLDKNKAKLDDWDFIKKKIENEIERSLFKETGRHPLIIVHSIFF